MGQLITDISKNKVFDELVVQDYISRKKSYKKIETKKYNKPKIDKHK